MHGLAQFLVASVVVASSLSFPVFLRADEARVAVASNFSQAMDALITEFEQATPHTLEAVYGSSGRLYAQISNGAPFDAFLSADTVKPSMLEENGFAVQGSKASYAVGRLALWTNKGLDKVRSLDAVKAADVKTVAIANPRLAPYGMAGKQVLESLGFEAALPFTLVQGENIVQAYQFVFTGNADIGFVALSQVSGPANQVSGSYWLIPAELHEPIVQDLVLLKRGQSNPAARAFVGFLKGSAAGKIIQSYGYASPSEAGQDE